MTNIENLKQRTEFAKEQIKQILKDMGLCFYGINKQTNEIYIADRQDVVMGEAQFAIGITIEQVNNL